MPLGLQSVLGVFFTEQYTRFCWRRFGPVVTLRVFGVGEFVAVSEPGLIKQLFSGGPDVLRAGELNARFVGTLARSSVLVFDGEPHLRLRRLLLPPFHGEALRRHQEVIKDVALAEVERWQIGKPFAIWPRMQAITLEVIVRAVIGVRDHDRLRRLRAVLPGVLRVNLLWLFVETAHPGLVENAVGRRLPWVRARRELYRLLDEEIAAHRADPDGREDILAQLMAARDQDGRGLSDEELRDQLATLLSAGHETTSATLAWCFERLVRHPAALARLQHELASDGDAYLDAVINETLRVRPVIDQVTRKLASPLELAGRTLPAGTTVAASILGVQRSPEIYPDPEAFRPERFLDQPPPPYALIPFGGGTHRCLGASFAMAEMKTVLRAVVETAELRAASRKPERPTRWRSFSTIPSRGARVMVTAKRRALPRPAARVPNA